jgi:HSP20 family protein
VRRSRGYSELRGTEKDNIDVNVSERFLTIKAEKKKEKEVKEKDYLRSERSYGSFVRALELPMEVQTDKIKAAFKISEIHLPETEEAKKKKIKVKVD